MKRRTLVLTLALLTVFLVSGALAGEKFKVGEWTIDTNSVLTPTTSAGLKAIYELATTNDTVSANETGKVFAVRLADGATSDIVVFTLPTAAVGLQYTFILADDTSVSLDSAETDTFIYENPPMSAGQILWNSTAATGDSVSIFCPVANYWVVDVHSGTWQSSN